MPLNNPVPQDDLPTDNSVPQNDLPSGSAAPIHTQYSALSDSTAENILAGVGMQFNKLYQGAKQIGASGIDAVAGTHLRQGVDQDVANSRQTDRDLANSTAGKAGSILGSAALMLAAPEGVLGAGIAGAAQGGLEATQGNESRLTNTLLGGAGGAAGAGLGILAGKALGRLIQPFRSVGSPEMDASVIELAANGVPMTAAQNLGYGAKVISLEQRQAFTKAVLSKLGINSESADATTMTAIKGTLGNTFDAIAARNPVNIDQQLISHLQSVESMAGKELTPEQMSVLQRQIDNIHILGSSNNGALPGETFNNLRTQLNRVASNPQQPVLNFWLDKVEDGLHSAMSRSASPQDAQLLAQTRQSWRMLKQVEPAIDSENLVSPSRLYNTIDKTKNANQSIYGQGPQALVSLAQAGKNVLAGGSAPQQFWNTSRILAYTQIGAQLGAVEELMRGNVKGAGALQGVAVGKSLLQAVAQNPKVGAMVGGWAKSQILKGWRNAINENAAKLGGRISGGAIDANLPQDTTNDNNVPASNQ